MQAGTAQRQPLEGTGRRASMRAGGSGARALGMVHKNRQGRRDGHGGTNREAMAADGLQGRRVVASGDVQLSLCGAPGGKDVEKVSLVEAWNIKMTRHDADHVLISYQPLVSSAINCHHRSDSMLGIHSNVRQG